VPLGPLRSRPPLLRVPGARGPLYQGCFAFRALVHRTCAAFRARRRFSSSLRFLRLAFPPLRPRATAWGFLGLVSVMVLFYTALCSKVNSHLDIMHSAMHNGCHRGETRSGSRFVATNAQGLAAPPDTLCSLPPAMREFLDGLAEIIARDILKRREGGTGRPSEIAGVGFQGDLHANGRDLRTL
jgi:hypothetical protein